MKETKNTKVRAVEHVVRAQATSDGAGVQLLRTIGTPTLDHVDPFLLLDEFRSEDGADYVGGFPDHPHRGFETVTYMLAGRMRHRDHSGNEGVLRPGSVQWMTAGRGIVHSEMPEQEEGLMHGFQLWVNLPAELKLMEPRYQDIPPEEVPEVRAGQATVRIVAGTFAGVEGPVRGVVTKPTYLDVHLPRGARFEHELPADDAAFVYVYEGGLIAGEAVVPPNALGQLGPGERIDLEAGADARFLLISASPIGEPVARYGPFVMNTQAELAEAFADYQAGRLGVR